MGLTFTKPRFLLCEGDEDKGFLETLIQARSLPDFQVCYAAECNDQRVGGRVGFRYALDPGIQPLKGFDQLKGILIISDNDTPNSFNEVKEALGIYGYALPGTPADVGNILGKPFAIRMIPSEENGDLQKLCFPEVARKWPEAPKCVDAFLQCTGADKWAKASSISKARFRSATVGFNEDDPYKGLHHLFRNGTLSAMNPCFDSLAAFLSGSDEMVGI